MSYHTAVIAWQLICSSVAIGMMLHAAALDAQTKTVALAWDYPATPAVVSTFTQSVLFDGAAVTTPPTCAAKTGSTTDTTCAIVIPAPAVGPHTLTVSASLNGNTATTTITGVDPNKAPPNAANARLTITVTIAIP